MAKRTVIVEGELGPASYSFEDAVDADGLIRSALKNGWFVIPANSEWSAVGAAHQQGGKTKSDRYFPAARLISVS